MKASAALKKEADAGDCWRGFRGGDWQTSINVRDFIVRNVTPYTSNEDFLAAPSQRTKSLGITHHNKMSEMGSFSGSSFLYLDSFRISLEERL